MSREQRTRLNNMIAERAPGAAIPAPGKATQAEDELADESAEQAEAQPEQLAESRRRSVFDAPLQSDLDRDTGETPPDDDVL